MHREYSRGAPPAWVHYHAFNAILQRMETFKPFDPHDRFFFIPIGAGEALLRGLEAHEVLR
jgi:hypothetical protein